jgi:hypothetical protein
MTASCPPRPAWSDTDLDALLQAAPDPAPPDFSDRLLQRLADAQAVPDKPTATARWRRLGERAALLAAAALGMGQVLAFIFGLWATTAAAA